MAKVLIVDDEEHNRLLLSTLLEHVGHTSFEAASVATGAALALQERPDLIVVDLSLADVSGVELIRQLRADPTTAQTKIALYTATRLTPALCDVMGIYDIVGVIPKPGGPQEILAAFAALLD